MKAKTTNYLTAGTFMSLSANEKPRLAAYGELGIASMVLQEVASSVLRLMSCTRGISTSQLKDAGDYLMDVAQGLRTYFDFNPELGIVIDTLSGEVEEVSIDE